MFKKVIGYPYSVICGRMKMLDTTEIREKFKKRSFEL